MTEPDHPLHLIHRVGQHRRPRPLPQTDEPVRLVGQQVTGVPDQAVRSDDPLQLGKEDGVHHGLA